MQDTIAAWIARRDPTRWVMGVLVLAFTVTFFALAAGNQFRFATYGFDLGIYDQATWLLAFGHDPFITVRGIDVFGHHNSPGLYVFAQSYWLGGGPLALLAAQVVSQALGACALYLLARDRMQQRWLGVGLALAYLLHPTNGWLTWEFFHPESLAIGPLLFAYWAARQARWGWFWVTAAFAITLKEDVALVLFVLGLLVAWWGNRRLGVVIAGVATTWFLISTRIVIPWRNGIGTFYESRFGEFGDSPFEVAWYIVRHPLHTLEVLTRPDRLEYYKQIFFPVGLVALLAPEVLAIALPMLLVNSLTFDGFPYTRDAHYHYSALVLVGVFAATVEAVARVTDRRVRVALVVWVLVAAFASNWVWGISPISRDYDAGAWRLPYPDRQDEHEAVRDTIPSDEPTSASYRFVPQLTHRTEIYEFPAPWQARIGYWGVQGEGAPNPSTVEWLAVDRRSLDAEQRVLLDELLACEFASRYDEVDLVAAERVKAPGECRDA